MKSQTGRSLMMLGIVGCFFLSVSCAKSESPPAYQPLPLAPSCLPEQIPFSDIGEGRLVFDRIGPEGNSYEDVYVIDAAAGTSWKVNIPSVMDGPQVSPDGSRIAGVMPSYTDSLYDVFTIEIDGTQPQNISSLAGQDRQPSWTPDGQRVLFWVMNPPDIPLYIQTATPNPPDRAIIRTFSLQICGPVSVSNDLRAVFLWNPGWGQWQIFRMNLDGTDAVALAPVAPTGRHYYSPVWSPDGTRIAYLMTEENASTGEYFSLELFVMDADGHDVRSVARFNTDADGAWAGWNDISVCWSPDGTKLAFNKKEGHLSSHIFLINSDGTGLVQLTSEPGVTDRSLSWSR